ncbi:MAG TPA: hypothetical protein VFX15_06385 [Actinomycetes bacterium]|nr:hypothetical protein [Actinomycetes bacterium]
MIIKAAFSALLAVSGVAFLPASFGAAGETAPTAKVRVVERPAVLRDDGGVRVIVAATCDARLQAFEMGVSITQYQAAGFLLKQAPPAVVQCDGLRHRQRVVAYPDEGAFSAGRANVSLYVGFYDPAQDRDLARRDSATVAVVQN